LNVLRRKTLVEENIDISFIDDEAKFRFNSHLFLFSHSLAYFFFVSLFSHNLIHPKALFVSLEWRGWEGFGGREIERKFYIF
jgi:hypothetical protein